MMRGIGNEKVGLKIINKREKIKKIERNEGERRKRKKDEDKINISL